MTLSAYYVDGVIVLEEIQGNTNTAVKLIYGGKCIGRRVNDQRRLRDFIVSLRQRVKDAPVVGGLTLRVLNLKYTKSLHFPCARMPAIINI